MEERETLRVRLEGLRDDALGRARALDEQVADVEEARRGTNVDDEHDPEGVTLAVDRAQSAVLADDARRQVVEADTALARLAAGTYGICERCGRPVGAARLEARPTARRCVECQRLAEEPARA